MAVSAQTRDGALTTDGVNSLISGDRRKRMRQLNAFLCGHLRTPENLKPHGPTHRCLRCYEASKAERRRLIEERDNDIRAYVASGKSMREAAAAFRLHYDTVRRIVGSQEMLRRSALIRDPLFSQRALRVAAQAVGANPDQLKQDWRDKPLVHARWAFMAAMNRRGASLGRIGRILNRDHTTVMYGIRQAQKLAESKPDFAALMAKVEAA